MRRLILLASLVLAPALAPAAVQADADQALPPTIAIIIDDVGHSRVEGERLIAIEQPLTLAFLPYRRFTRTLVEEAHNNNKEIMLHSPMANTHDFDLGPGGLTADMNRSDTIQTLRRSLQAIPYVSGVNNHMGSLLTQQIEPMEWVMSELYQYPLYFVDSRTIASSVAADVAEAYRIPTLRRDVFLDNEQTEEYVDQQFQRLLRIARENGTAIAIGHPHEVTVSYLEKHLPELDEQGIAIATVSGIWALRNQNREMFAEGEKQPITSILARTQDK